MNKRELRQWRHKIVLLLIKWNTPDFIYTFLLKQINMTKPRYQLYCNTCASMYPDISRVLSIGGIDQCSQCSDLSDLGGYTEIEPDSVKSARNEYAKSLIQPYRNGEASAEYAEAYPERAARMFKGQKVREVWKDTLPYYWRKTK